MSVLFPAFGIPTSPTSAMSFSSSLRFLSWPGFPFVVVLGVWFVGEAKDLFPLPPLPPRQTRTFISTLLRSFSIRSRSSS